MSKITKQIFSFWHSHMVIEGIQYLSGSPWSSFQFLWYHPFWTTKVRTEKKWRQPRNMAKTNLWMPVLVF